MDFGDDRHRHATIGLRVGALGLGTPLFDGWSRTSWFSSFKARFSSRSAQFPLVCYSPGSDDGTDKIIDVDAARGYAVKNKEGDHGINRMGHQRLGVRQLQLLIRVPLSIQRLADPR
jgi:hypothetical protein